MTVEVSVHLQVPAAADLVKSATEEVRVGNEALDAREPFEEVHKDLAVQLGEQGTGRWARPGRVSSSFDLISCSSSQRNQSGSSGEGNRPSSSIERVGLEKIVDHDVLKRFPAGELVAMKIRQVPQSILVEPVPNQRTRTVPWHWAS